MKSSVKLKNIKFFQLYVVNMELTILDQDGMDS